MYMYHESRRETGEGAKGKRASRGPQGAVCALYVVNLYEVTKIKSPKQLLRLGKFSPQYVDQYALCSKSTI